MILFLTFHFKKKSGQYLKWIFGDGSHLDYIFFYQNNIDK